MTEAAESNTQLIGNQAIVIGGGVSGLFSAAVLAKFYKNVLVIDRDTFPEKPEVRKGVPQARHTHLMLLEGKRFAEYLFPGIDDDLSRLGASSWDFIKDYKLLLSELDNWAPRFDSGLIVRSSTRNLFEWAFRQRVRRIDRVTFLPSHEIVELVIDQPQRQIRGVRARLFGNGDADAQSYDADLVVCALGKNSKALAQLLSDIDCRMPRETRVSPHMGYASRLYQIPESQSRDWKTMRIEDRVPDFPIGASIMPVENNQWIVTCSGTSERYPGTDEESFQACLKELRRQDIAEALEGAEPTTKISGWRGGDSCIYHFEEIDNLPDGFVLVGDSVCTFNPKYGQGMSTAARGVALLEKCIAERAERGSFQGITADFQSKLAEAVAEPFWLGSSVDLAWPGTDGKRDYWASNIAGWFLRTLIRAGEAGNNDVYQAFIECILMNRPLNHLLVPEILVPVMKNWINQWETSESDRSNVALPVIKT